MPVATMPSKTAYCSLFSQQSHEPLIASAIQTRFYFLLEYPHPWGAKALEESDMDEEVKAHLKKATKAISDSRLLLIKKAKRLQKEITFYFIRAEVTQSALYAFHLEDYRQLIDLDLSMMAQEGYPNLEEKRSSKKLLLVCTNGKRDRCCAKFGLPTLKAVQGHLADEPQWEVWQSSHVGGHRFAPNVLVMPWGLLYGRILPDEVGSLIESVKKEEIVLNRLRGRTCWPPFVQAAEYLLRQEEKQNALKAYDLLSTTEVEPNQWEVHFIESNTRRIHHLQIQKVEKADQVYESCQFDKSAPVITYSLIQHTCTHE